MKKMHKRYIALSVMISTFIFISYVAGVYIIDPAGINNRFDLGLIKDSRFAFRTQKYIELNEVKPDTIMLGGSRVHYLNTDDVKHYTEDNVYNLGLSSSTLEEQYYFLQYSIDHFDIKHVIIGVNLYPFSEDLISNKNSDFDKEIFTTGFTLQKQFHHYLSLPMTKYVKQCIKKGYKQPLYKNGSVTAYQQAFRIGEKSWQKREKSKNEYQKIYSENLVWGETGLATFKKMVQLCRQHDIDLKVFTTAIYVSQLQILQDVNKMDIYYRWKKELAKVTPYWDFMYINSVTKNDKYFIDTSHIRQEYGYLYFATMFHDKSLTVPNNFGVYVNQNNIDEHIKQLKSINDTYWK